MSADNPLRVLVIEDSINDAEMLVSLIRNSGTAVRSATAEDTEELSKILDELPLDLVLCSTECEEPSLQQIELTFTQRKLQIPVIAITSEEDIDPEEQLQVMKTGARDLCSKENPEHLLLVVNREVENYRMRRKLAVQEQSMLETEKRVHSLLENSRDAIAYVHEGMHIYANPVYLEMFGFHEVEEIDGTPIMDMVSPDHHDKFKNFLRQYSHGEEKTKELEVHATQPDGTTFNAVMEFSPASIDGEPCTQIIIRNQSINKELEKKIKYLSKQDLLTGLYNRQYFLEELNGITVEKGDNQTQWGMMLLEPDNFKATKEKVGIAGSDLVLGDIAKLITDSVNETSIAARFGDHTFAILVPASNADDLKSSANRIREKIEGHIAEIGGKSITTTCSIGVSLLDPSLEESQSILSHADLACEMAKKDGGNQVHVHNPVTDESAGRERDQVWNEMIRNALKNDRFMLLYQPIANLHGSAGEKYEILIRMLDPDGNEVLPGQFLPTAEKYNLLSVIDRWVIAKAVSVLAERRQNGNDTMFFVKLSGQTLSDEKLLLWISELLKKTRLPGDSLVFELSEKTALDNLKNAKLFIKGVSQLRCRFGLEHFGTAAASNQLLKHLPADYIKIHHSFTRNLATNKENQAKVKEISEMAKSIGKHTIAVSVEDPNSLAVLWQCGVSYIQGNFLQSPDERMNYDFDGDES